MAPIAQSVRPLHQLLGARYAVPSTTQLPLIAQSSSPPQVTQVSTPLSVSPQLPLSSRTTATLHPAQTASSLQASSYTLPCGAAQQRTPSLQAPSSSQKHTSSQSTMAPGHLLRTAKYSTNAFKAPSLREARYLHTTTSRMQYKKEDVMDRNALNPQSTEYSKSGGDPAASHSSEAFDASKTRDEHYSDPQDSSSPLNVSPGNKHIREGVDGQADVKTKANREDPAGPNKASGGGNTGKTAKTK